MISLLSMKCLMARCSVLESLSPRVFEGAKKGPRQALAASTAPLLALVRSGSGTDARVEEGDLYSRKCPQCLNLQKIGERVTKSLDHRFSYRKTTHTKSFKMETIDCKSDL